LIPNPHVYEFAGVVFDEVSKRLRYRGRSAPLAPRCFLMLRALVSNANKAVSAADLNRAVSGGGDRGASLRSIKSLVTKAFKNLGVQEKMLIQPVSGGYRLETIYPQRGRDHEALELSTHLIRSNPNGFCLIVDGMIIDIVGELLKHDDSMVGVMQRARLTYKQGIEDFAFAVVYATAVLTSTDVTDRSNDPGRYSRADITSRLGSLWQAHTLDDDLKFGSILHDNKIRGVIRQDIAAVSRCIEKEGWAFRDWFLGEIPRHLGEDETLFERKKDPSQYVFKVGILTHYIDPELQASIEPHALGIIVDYLKSATKERGNNYAEAALQEFASRDIMGLVTIMRENDLTAERTGQWRVPHILRRLAKRELLLGGNVQQQIHLKSIVVQHALASALRQVRDIDRGSLITELLNMRSAYPFREIRERLENDHLVLSHPQSESEPRARDLLNEIYRLTNPTKEHPDRVLLAQQSALRELGRQRADQYESQLYRVFPALRPPNIIVG
jgi:DNA-binding winged helix-turn-helix (wHTH) protein